MIKIIFFALALVVGSASAQAQEYCVDKYNDSIVKVSSELGGLVKRQAAIDKRMAEIFVRQGQIANEIAAAATKVPPDTATVQRLAVELDTLNREKATLTTEGYSNQDKIVALKGVIPANLQGQLRGCIEATAPANKLVNLAIQAMAILSTGGLSLALPPKSLYIDMSAVLNGYPTGGPKSVINQARQGALNALGIGGENNDLGKTIKDPGRIFRCISGC